MSAAVDVEGEKMSSKFLAASSARHEAVKAQREARLRTEEATTVESSSVFWESFRREKESIALALREVEGDKSEKFEAVVALEGRGRGLSASITAATAYLSAYDVKRAAREAKETCDAVAEAKKKLAPRKKFGFQRKPPPQEAASKDVAAAAAKKTMPENAEEGGKGPPQQQNQNIDKKKTTLVFERTGFFGERGRVLVWQTTEEAGEVHLDDLEDCVVFVAADVSTLRMRKLRRCQVFARCVAGPAYVQDVTASSLRLVSRQLRIHDTYDTDFYVHLATGPIIEDCHRLRFAKYAMRWCQEEEGGKKHTFKAQVLPLRPDAWKDVQDFKWLRVDEPSPHFRLIPEADYARHLPKPAAADADRLGLRLIAADQDSLPFPHNTTD